MQGATTKITFLLLLNRIYNNKRVIYLRTLKTVFIIVKTWSIFKHLKYFNRDRYTIECDFCARTVTLEQISMCVILVCCRKQSRIPADGVDKRRKAKQFTRD
jgi:hypothetical protein